MAGMDYNLGTPPIARFGPDGTCAFCEAQGLDLIPRGSSLAELLGRFGRDARSVIQRLNAGLPEYLPPPAALYLVPTGCNRCEGATVSVYPLEEIPCDLPLQVVTAILSEKGSLQHLIRQILPLVSPLFEGLQVVAILPDSGGRFTQMVRSEGDGPIDDCTDSLSQLIGVDPICGEIPGVGRVRIGAAISGRTALTGILLVLGDEPAGLVASFQLNQIAALLGRVARNLEQRQSLLATLQASRVRERELDCFLREVNHGIRTPLNGVIGMTALLFDTELTGEQREYAELVREASRHLLEVIDGMLVRADTAADLEQVPEPFNLRWMLDEVVRVLLSKRPQPVLYEYPATIPDLVVGDPAVVRSTISRVLQEVMVAGRPLLLQADGRVLESRQYRFSLRMSLQSEFPDISTAILDQVPAEWTEEWDADFGRVGVLHFPLLLQRPFAQASSIDIPALVPRLRALLVAPAGVLPHLRRLFLAMGMRILERTDTTAALSLLEGGRESFDLLVLDAAVAAGFPDASSIPPRLILGDALPGGRTARVGYCIPPFLTQELITEMARLVQGEKKRVAPVQRNQQVDEQGGRILVVEDNPVNQLMAVRILERRGFSCVVADSGAPGVERFRQEPFDLILMDIQMPGMDGFTATKAIRILEGERGGAPVPIVAVTAHIPEQERQRCLDAGMDDFLAKPIRGEILCRTVCRHLDRVRKKVDQLAGTPLLNRESVLQRLGDEALYDQLLTMFSEDAPAQVAKLQQAFGQGDLAYLALIAHGLKGAAGNIGATDLQQQALALEHAANSGALDRVATGLQQLAHQVDELCRTINPVQQAG